MKKTKQTTLEEFETIGIVRVLKEAQGFNKAQYLLMIKLFEDFILSKALDEQRDGIISEIAQYSGINDIQTKELIKIIKEL
jgi:hypothetical protein